MGFRTSVLDRVLGIADVPGARRWALVALVDSIGTGLLAPITVLYFTLQVGISPAGVGSGLAIAGVAALLLTPLAGLAIDHFGAKRTVIGYWLGAAAAYAGYGLVHRWWSFVLVATVALISEFSAKPAKQTFVAQLAQGADRVKLMAFQRSVRNAGYSLGGLLAAAALAVGGAAYGVVIYGNALSFVLAVVVISTIKVGAGAPRQPSRRPSLADYGLVLRDRRYVALTALDFLATFHATALTIALPLWVADRTSAPTALVGVLFTVNTVLVVLLQVRATKGVEGVDGVPPVFVRAAVLFALAASAYLTASLVGQVVAVVLLVLGLLLHTASELYASVAQWTTSIELAPEQDRGKYLALFSFGQSLQQAVGPAVITGIFTLWAGGLWICLAVLMVLGSLISARITHLVTTSPMRLDASPTNVQEVA